MLFVANFFLLTIDKVDTEVDKKKKKKSKDSVEKLGKALESKLHITKGLSVKTKSFLILLTFFFCSGNKKNKK